MSYQRRSILINGFWSINFINATVHVSRVKLYDELYLRQDQFLRKRFTDASRITFGLLRLR
ncbi:protein of unknown function [Chryseobacterium sp. JV274]|nr:protein of unknown function [Chryseobacterium sp. JV274]